MFQSGDIEIISAGDVVAKDDELDYWTEHIHLSPTELQALIDGDVLLIPGNTCSLFVRVKQE